MQHFTSQREEFEGTREGILVWLTEMDLQLTNVEHFSQSDIEDKMRQLRVRPPVHLYMVVTEPTGNAEMLELYIFILAFGISFWLLYI